MRVRTITEPKISIVIPARNEARSLEAVLPRLPKVHEVILVDGHSVDGTVETARRALSEIRVIRQTRNGKGNALACGFAAVTGDIVVMFDADGSADPAEIPALVGALVAGADVAKGTRFAGGGGSEDITRSRSLGHLGLNLITNSLLGTRYTDLCYGYNAFWADVLPALQLPDVLMPARSDGRMEWGDGFEIVTVLNCRVACAGMRVTEVGSVERLRMFGRSNPNAVSGGLRVLRTIVTEVQRLRRAGVTRADVRALSRGVAT